MKIAVACDHGGLNLKNALIQYLEKNGHEVKDFGTYTKDSCDYPDYALQAAEAVAQGECERGIVALNKPLHYSKDSQEEQVCLTLFSTNRYWF